METEISLIITVVNKGWGDKVLEASMNAGAEGGTILLGRGIGIHDTKSVLGICIEPAREVILSLTYPEKKDEILQEIVSAAELDKPGTGIAFVVPIEKVAGIAHRFQSGSKQSQPKTD